jgi:hypothetical protein
MKESGLQAETSHVNLESGLFIADNDRDTIAAKDKCPLKADGRKRQMAV